MAPMADHATIERLRYLIELFVDGSDRSPEHAQAIAEAIQEVLPPDDVIDAFVTTAAVYGQPACAFYRTEEEMVKECEDLRRYLTGLG